MSFPAYPAYKHSSVEWLGDIPSHWNIKKFRYVFEESPEKITDEVVGDMLSVSGYRGIEVKQYDDEGRRRTDEELFGYRVVRPGQLVVNTMWLNYAGLGVSEHEGHVSPAYRSYWIDPAMDKRFIHHLMRSGTYVQGYTRLLTGIRPNSLQMGRDDLMVFPVLLPTKSEQTQIARFLDHETARIDALIEEQQRLIELLKEKRQAVISHAVTKGLDPTVPMKDSGVEWLGEVPCSWKVIKFGITHETAELGGNYESGESQEGLPLIKMGNIGRGKIKLDKVEYVSADQNIDNCHILREGDFLFNTRNSLDLVGKVCVWQSELSTALYNSNILRISFVKNLVGSSGFVNYLLNSDLGLEQLRLIARGTTSVAAIYYKDLSSLSFAFPSPSEQLEIEKFLDIQTTKLDALVVAAEQAIDLIKERRSALISAAVTGKIDVRGWQPPARTPAPELAVAEAE